MNQDKPTRKSYLTRRDALKLLGAGTTGTLAANLLQGASTDEQREGRLGKPTLSLSALASLG